MMSMSIYVRMHFEDKYSKLSIISTRYGREFVAIILRTSIRDNGGAWQFMGSLTIESMHNLISDPAVKDWRNID